MPNTLTVRTPALEIAYEAYGRERGAPRAPPSGVAGAPLVLPPGFPAAARAFDAVAPPLAAAGHRVLVPYLRGYGPTRFLDPADPRVAPQAATGTGHPQFTRRL